jgi:UDP-N-acetyl-D-mannosaminuronic acid dehydrogenase
VGGHCISVDPWFLVEAAPDLTPLIHTSRQVNDRQPHFVVSLVQRALGTELKGRRIAALGLSFKPDVDDLRESPAVEICHLLQDAGAIITAHEPFKPEEQLPGLHTVLTLAEALKDAEALLLLVGHSQLRELKAAEIAALTPARLAIDTVNGWNAAEWQAQGFRMYRLGVGREL